MDLSFSNQVKNEICQLYKMPEQCKVVLLYGVLFASRCFNETEIVFLSESPEVSKYVSDLINRIYKQKLSVTELFSVDNKKPLYQIKISDKLLCKEISESFNRGKYAEYISLLSINEDMTWSFIKGLFLSCGSVSSPETDYHLEFYFRDRQTALFSQNMLSSLGFYPKILKRRNEYIVYFKDSSLIEDILAGIGAMKSVLQLMDSKVLKDIRNKINRQTNCETANMRKTISASAQQVKAITYIYQKKGSEFLSDDLKKIADFRLENPNMSLNEMAETLNGEFSKSSIDRRLKKLVLIANDIK